MQRKWLKLAENGRHYGTGRRKTSVARVWLAPGSGQITINNKPATEYLHRYSLEQMILEPLEATETLGQYDVIAHIKGGGISSQAGAIRHGIAKALVAADEEYRTILGPLGMLTRDPRAKERKHAGFRRARRGKQFSKR